MILRKWVVFVRRGSSSFCRFQVSDFDWSTWWKSLISSVEQIFYTIRHVHDNRIQRSITLNYWASYSFIVSRPKNVVMEPCTVVWTSYSFSWVMSQRFSWHYYLNCIFQRQRITQESHHSVHGCHRCPQGHQRKNQSNLFKEKCAQLHGESYTSIRHSNRYPIEMPLFLVILCRHIHFFVCDKQNHLLIDDAPTIMTLFSRQSNQRLSTW